MRQSEQGWYDTEDARQDAYLEAHQQLRFRDDVLEPCDEMIAPIVSCRAPLRLIDHIRRDRREHELSWQHNVWALWTNRRASKTPQTYCMHQEMSSILADLICRLPQTQRQVVSLKYIEGLTTRQIADELSVSPQAVGQCLDRACHRLRNEPRLRSLIDDSPRTA